MVLNFWNGHKTNLLALAGSIASFVFAMEWIDVKTFLALGGLLGFGATTTLRHGIAQTEAAITDKVEAIALTTRVVAREVAEVKAVVQTDTLDTPQARPLPHE